jgi:hypothetical protein
LDKRLKKPHIQAGYTMEEMNPDLEENRTLYSLTY